MPARLADNEVKNEQTVAYPLDPTLGKMLRRVFAFGAGTLVAVVVDILGAQVEE